MRRKVHGREREDTLSGQDCPSAGYVGGLPDGKVHLSTDGGLTWTPHLEDRTWRGVAFSGNGQALVAAANGGHVYVSRGHRTTAGMGGSILGDQGSRVELVYLGEGLFSVREASGDFKVD